MSKNKGVFLELVRAGLWEADANLNPNEYIDWDEVYQLAEEQSVVGLVLAGIGHSNVKPPQELLLQWIGEVQMLEQQNKEMNSFVAQLIEKLRRADIYTLLLKGQGIAQCYEKPLWRASGDIDLLLDEVNYEKGKDFLIPIADEVQSEDTKKKHQAIIIKGFDVELHGKMPFGLSRKADKVIDSIIEDSLKLGGARAWSNNNTDIYLPNTDNDVILVFTHFLRHFFIEGVGLRQICDWCRLLWKYKDKLDSGLLESRIRKAGLMTEWQVFGAMAVESLGMPAEAMPLFNDNANDNHRSATKGDACLCKNLNWWNRWRAKRVLERVMKSGNFGHNNDLSYRANSSGFTYKFVAFWRRLLDFIGLSQVFPIDGPIFFITYLLKKVC